MAIYKQKVAKVHRKISNCREDFLHKLSRRMVDENQVIIVEKLNVKGIKIGQRVVVHSSIMP